MKKSLFILSAALLPFVFSCRENAPQEDLFVKLDRTELSFDNLGTVHDGATVYPYDQAYAQQKDDDTYLCPRLTLRSNLDSWEIVPEYAEDKSWIFIQPSTGSGSGKFFVSVDENRYAAPRTAVVNVVSHGKVQTSFTIAQTGAEPYLELDMGGITRYSVAPEGCDVLLRLKTNAQWNIVASDPSWLEFLDRADESIVIRVQPNPGDDKRSSELVISMAGEGGEDLKCSFIITQLGSAEAFSKATRKNFSEVLGLSGTIEENIYVEGCVVSDYRAQNVAKHRVTTTVKGATVTHTARNTQMWLQNDAGDALCVEFASSAENKLLPGTRVKVHLVGMTAGVETETGMYRINGLSQAYLHDITEGAVPAPFEITDLSKVPEYENKLVVLKNVAFAMPYGTLFNVDELNSSRVYEFFEDASPNEYAHLLVNAAGQSVRLMTAGSVPWRHVKLMPKGSGDVVGIVCRRLRFGVPEFVIRLQSLDGLRISDDESTSFYRPLVRFGPFTEKLDMEKLVSDIGFAEMKTSRTSKVAAAGGNTDVMTLNAWAYIWNTTFAEGNEIFPSRTESNMYSVINASQWYNGTGTSITDDPGEAWIITLSTLTAGTGKLYLAFANASYARGPKDFRLEWSTDEATSIDDWNAISDYEAYSLNANWALGVYFIPLPDEMKGKEKVVIRHRVSSEESTYTYTHLINTGGTNRIAYWTLIEM